MVEGGGEAGRRREGGGEGTEAGNLLGQVGGRRGLGSPLWKKKNDESSRDVTKEEGETCPKERGGSSLKVKNVSRNLAGGVKGRQCLQKKGLVVCDSRKDMGRKREKRNLQPHQPKNNKKKKNKKPTKQNKRTQTKTTPTQKNPKKKKKNTKERGKRRSHQREVTKRGRLPVKGEEGRG